MPITATIPTRSALRVLLRDALIAGVPEVSSRVLTGRAWPQQGAGIAAGTVFPALLVQDGAWILQGQASGFVGARCQYRIQARVQRRTETEIETDLDALNERIRAAVWGNAALNAAILCVAEFASERDVQASAQLGIGQDDHLVTFGLAGFVP